MCRSIKVLRTTEGPASDEEVAAAALQFVRKISGFRTPPKANPAAFDDAVAQVTAASQALLEALGAKRATSRAKDAGEPAPTATRERYEDRRRARPAPDGQSS
ncbi:MAG: DUF2277 domain-containing protein [Dehalococcoidia bacterium]